MADPSPALTEPQIEVLVERFKREMARYEKAANLVGERLRRELRQAGVKHMVSSRPKHPKDLAEKLRKKAAEKPDVYRWETLKDDLGAVVTDLAGCRVVVYSAADEEAVGAMVSRLFAQPARPDAAVDRRRGVDKAYWATHALVHPYAASDANDVTVEGAVCELQIVTAAAHLFNEIEHDITYKDRDAGLTANEEERQLVLELRGVARVADRLVEQVLQVRARRREELSQVIQDAEELRFALLRQANRRIDGPELGHLLSLLEQCLDQVTPAAIRELGTVDAVVAEGRKRLGDDAKDYAETILFAVGLLAEFGPEIQKATRRWRGPRTAMRRALELALERQGPQNPEGTP